MNESDQYPSNGQFPPVVRVELVKPRRWWVILLLLLFMGSAFLNLILFVTTVVAVGGNANTFGKSITKLYFWEKYHKTFEPNFYL